MIQGSPYINQQEEIRKPVILREPMTWMKRGACKNAPADQFFPEKSSGSTDYKIVIAEYCNVCPVKQSCLNFAIDNFEVGIWGGTTTRGRAAIRSKMVKERKAQCQQ
jgi:hypothetical protein